MGKAKKILMIFMLGMGLSLISTGCKTGEGCEMNNPDKLGAKTDKDGNMSTKRGKSNLFSKKQRKKMKRP